MGFVADREVCPTCERFLPVPEEQREPRVRGQVGLSFPTPEEADSYRELLGLARERLDAALGVGKRVMAGTVAHAALYDWLQGGHADEHDGLIV